SHEGDPGEDDRVVTGGGAIPSGGPAPRGNEVEADRARRTARDFEGVFLRMLLDRMLPEDGGGLFGGGPAAGIVRGMFVEKIGASLAARRALGIADLIETNLMREPAPAAGTPLERSE